MTPAPLQWYAELPARRARQVLADAAVALVVLALALLARAVHGAVRLLGAPGRELQDAGNGLRDALTRAGERADDVPVVGGGLRAPLDAAAGAGDALVSAGAAQESAVDRLALLLALLVLLPAGALAVRHLRARLRQARDTGAAAALRADVDLLALRAATSAPLPQLARLGADPVSAWRRGDRAAGEALAALALRDLGLRPGGAGTATPPGSSGRSA